MTCVSAVTSATEGMLAFIATLFAMVYDALTVPVNDSVALLLVFLLP